MFKLLAVICIFLALSAVHSQSCSATSPLRSLYGIGNTLTTAQTYSDIKYCKSIKNGPVCCTNTDINNFATKSANLVNNLTSMVSTRDKYLKNFNDNILPGLTTDLKNFVTAMHSLDDMFNDTSSYDFSKHANTTNTAAYDNYTAAYNNYTAYYNWTMSFSNPAYSNYSSYGNANSYNFSLYSNYTVSFPDPVVSDDVGVDQFGDLLASFELIAMTLTSGFNDIKANYVAYQKSRTSCVVEAVKLQNAAYCLACDPNATSKGFSTSNGFGLSMSNRVCNRLKSSCNAYITKSIDQSDIIGISYYASIIGQLVTGLQSIVNGKEEQGDKQVMQAFNTSIADPSSNLVTPADTPYGCDNNGTCDWICDGLFTNGQLDQEALVVGGIFNASDDSSFRRLIQSDDKPNSFDRLLAGGGSFDPDSDEAGITVTFQDDPAGASTNNASKFSKLTFGNVFISMMVVISCTLLL